MKKLKRLIESITDFVLGWIRYSVFYFASALLLWVGITLINYVILSYWQCLGIVFVFRFIVGMIKSRTTLYLEHKFRKAFKKRLIKEGFITDENKKQITKILDEIKT